MLNGAWCGERDADRGAAGAPTERAGAAAPALEQRAARRSALRWAAGVLVLGNLAHMLWGEREEPSERYTVIKIAGLLPLTAWALRSRQLTLRGEIELARAIRLAPRRPLQETLAGLAAGAALATGLRAASLLPGLPERRAVAAWVAALEPQALLFRLAFSLPLTTVYFEELVFRGLLLRRFERAWSEGMAQLVTSVLFGLWHLAPGVQALARIPPTAAGLRTRVLAVLLPPLGTMPAGLVFGWLARRYQTLWSPLVAHWVAAGALFWTVRRTFPGRR